MMMMMMTTVTVSLPLRISITIPVFSRRARIVQHCDQITGRTIGEAE